MFTLAPHAVLTVAVQQLAGIMPEVKGRRIRVSVRPKLTAHKGKLLSRSSSGTPVYAGAMLEDRTITLDSSLLRTPRMLARIFVHEVFHFVWWRLGNPLRRSFEELVKTEFEAGVRGELGWSSESLKMGLTARDIRNRTNRWRMYVCESFCDTGGFVFGSSRQTVELTLDKHARALRRKWMRHHLAQRSLSI